MIKKISLSKAICILSWTATPAVAFWLLESLTHSVAKDMEWPLILMNLIFYYLLYGLILVISKRSWVSIGLGTLLVMIVGLVNYYVIQFRSVPLYPWDFLSIKTAASVSENYDYSLDSEAMRLLIGFGLLILIGFFARWKLEIKNRQYHLLSALVMMLLITVYGTSVQMPEVHRMTGFYEFLFTPTSFYRLNGFAASFISNMQYLNVSKPGDYSKAHSEAILSKYVPITPKGGQKGYPNVIVIMNEAFSDPAVLGDFETNMDYMPFIRSLTENTVKGNAYVSVKGGNTANSEFEFLTGDSMAYLPAGSIPYQQYIRSEMPTLVSQFQRMGYETSFIHPYRASGWNRKNIYDYFGFDKCYFKDAFTDAPILREYTTDLATYQKVVDIVNAREKDRPVFIFDVTMQNHSSYSKKYENFSPDVEVYGDVKATLLERYLSLIKISDRSFQKLVEYFEKREEPTVILMFGDHQPADWVVEPIYEMNSEGDLTKATAETDLKRYEVPFVMWANYDIEEADIEAISLNYLSTLLMEKAGLPLSPWQSYLKELSGDYPVVTANGWMDKEGIWHGNDTIRTELSAEGLREYHILNYYHLFDTKNREDHWFESSPET